MKTYRSKKYSRMLAFVALPWELLNSKAYISLPPSSGKTLPYFLGKVKLPFNAPERYTIHFTFSYTEARRLGFSNGTHHRNISELMAKGFIDPVCKGGKRGFGLSSSLFKLSERWKKFGMPDFNEIIWSEILPEFRKPKITPKTETYNSKNGATNANNNV